MKYIYHHLGLGDHIICNGLVRTLMSEDLQYTMFVRSHNRTTVEFMYRDLDNLFFIEVENFFIDKFIKKNNVNQQDLITAGFYTHPQSISFDDSFYLQNNVPFEYRWEKFKIIRDIKREMDLFSKFDVEENKYVFIHDDFSRGFIIDDNLIINKNLKIVRPIKGLTNNAFDYCYLMEKSYESHFIDSSFRLIFDSLQLRNNNIWYHINLLNGVIRDSSMKSQSKLNFNII